MRRLHLLPVVAATLLAAACGDGRSVVGEVEGAKSSSKIIHGALDTGTKHDAVVYIEFLVDPSSGLGGACSGSLIAPDVIATARHCVSAINDATTPPAFGADYDANTMYVYLSNEPRGTPDGEVARIVHSDARTLDNNDFALLVLKKPIGTMIAPVRLAAPPAVDEDTFVVGYGITELDTGATPTAIHKRYWRDNVKIQYLGPIPAYGIGAREVVVGEATCEGDSGGPMMDHTTGALLAVTSRGGNGTKPVSGSPSSTCTGTYAINIFSRVDGYADLIKGTLAGLGEVPWEEGTPKPSGTPKPVPPPGTLGAACSAPKDCASGVCVAVDGKQVCSQACTDPSTCPAGFDCISNYCLAAAPPAPADDAGPPPATDDAGVPPADAAGPQPESGATSSSGSKCSIEHAPSEGASAAGSSLLASAIASAIAIARRRRR